MVENEDGVQCSFGSVASAIEKCLFTPRCAHKDAIELLRVKQMLHVCFVAMVYLVSVTGVSVHETYFLSRSLNSSLDAYVGVFCTATTLLTYLTARLMPFHRAATRVFMGVLVFYVAVQVLKDAVFPELLHERPPFGSFHFLVVVVLAVVLGDTFAALATFFMSMAVAMISVLVVRESAVIAAYMIRSFWWFMWGTCCVAYLMYAEKKREQIPLLDLEKAIADAHALSQAKTEFVANISHEMRTPLTGIIGMVDVMLSDGDGVPARLNVINTCSRLLLSHINDVLDWSRLRSDGLVLEDLRINVRELLRSCALASAPRLSRNTKIKVKVSSHVPPELYGDPTKLMQALMNLTGNAVKFTGEGQITLRATRASQSMLEKLGVTLQEGCFPLMFSVKDTGIGLQPDIDHSRLFDDFTQADASHTRRFGGTGLGLPISRWIVRAMNGNVWASSPGKGKGSTFGCVVQLHTQQTTQLLLTHSSDRTVHPAFESDKSSTSLSEYSSGDTLDNSPNSPGEGGTPIRLRPLAPMPILPHVESESTQWAEAFKPNVLLVDDNKTNRMVIQLLLRKLGVEPSMAVNGQEAVEVTSKRKFDAILMDIQMPLMDGIQATGAIRDGDGLCKHVPIFALTATVHEVETYYVAGMQGFLSKPVTTESLSDVLSAWIPVECPKRRAFGPSTQEDKG